MKQFEMLTLSQPSTINLVKFWKQEYVESWSSCILWTFIQESFNASKLNLSTVMKVSLSAYLCLRASRPYLTYNYNN